MEEMDNKIDKLTNILVEFTSSMTKQLVELRKDTDDKFKKHSRIMATQINQIKTRLDQQEEMIDVKIKDAEERIVDETLK